MANPPTRIVFVTHSAVAAGAEILLLRMLEKYGSDLAKKATVVFLSDGELVAKFQKAGIDVKVLNAKGIAGFRREGRVASSLRFVRPTLATVKQLSALLKPGDLVIATSQKALVITALVRLTRSDLAGLVWWLHDILTPAHFSALSIRLGVLLSRLTCRQIIATSKDAKDAFIAAGGSIRRCKVIEPGIDLSLFHAEKPTEHKEIIALSVSRISPWKGQMTFIEALAEAPNVTAWIAGAPKFEEDEYLKTLKARAASLGVSDRVRFLGHVDDVAPLYREATMFVHVPSATEPFGQVVVEAMACGLPIVVSSDGAPGRMAAQGGGVSVPPLQPHLLADGLQRLASNPAERAQFSERAVQIAQGFEIDAMRARFQQTIMEELR